MTEDQARAWIAQRFDDEAVSALNRFADILRLENDRQNLIAPSTISRTWSRHFLDSAQLIAYAPRGWQHWVDIGSGAGLPGLVIAILTRRQTTLIEPRRLRAEFLAETATLFGLTNVSIIPTKANNARIGPVADVISARAVAPLTILFDQSQHFATSNTHYILPKGQSANSEVEIARRSWQGMFHVEQSIVDPTSGIVIASGVARR